MLGLDEVHERRRVILFATDPILDATVAWRVVEKNDQASMDAFLDELKVAGFRPEVVSTDGSPRDKDARQEVWEGVEQQLCICHVIKEVNQLVLDARRAIKNRLSRQGNKGRQKKRGRPAASAGSRRGSEKRTKKEEAAFLWKHQHRVVKKDETMPEEDTANLGEMIQMAPEVEKLRKFNRQFYALFARGITPRQARDRRTRMVNHTAYQAHAILKRARAKLRKERFEKMITFLARGEEAERTSNHVERNNRALRLVQKTRYRRRRAHTIELALWLHVCRAWRKHPRYGTIYEERSPGIVQQPPSRRVA